MDAHFWHNNLRSGWLRTLLFLALVAGQIFPPVSALAARGLPESPEFGFGARLDPWGQDVELALNAAASMHLDWIGIDFDWARSWPTAGQSADLGPLTAVLRRLQQHNTGVLLSITHAPDWALTPAGPDPQATAQLVSLLATLAPETLLAIELFPGANTAQGWGTFPDAAAYVQMLSASTTALQQAGSTLTLISGGLVPNPAQGIDDLDFLTQLYAAGSRDIMPVVSVRLVGLSGDAMAFPSDDQPAVLRRYERLRQVMLDHQHASGLIWVTGFAWPEDTSFARAASSEVAVDPVKERQAAQVSWLVQSFRLMRSQLYIGVAFYGCLNPSLGGAENACLIQHHAGQTALHPAMVSLGQLVTVAHLGASLPESEALKKIANPEFKQNLKAKLP